MLTVEELNDKLIDLAFSEDIGDGDHTTLCCIPADAMGESKLLIKQEGIFAGIEIAKQVFQRFDPSLDVEAYVADGAHVKPGDIVMSVKGREQSLLQCERLMLNILQRMSGIATMTHKYQQALIDAGTKTRVLDTRKAVEIVAGRCETESSGGITFDTMIPYAKAGVDFISFGGLTHSVKGLDMSFKAAGSDKLTIF